MPDFIHKLNRKLSMINESNQQITVYKWMSGENWKVNTREGKKAIGDKIIPLWVGGTLESMPIHFSLVFNNYDGDGDMYLVEIKTVYDQKSVTDKEYETFEFDDSNVHPVGSKAIIGEPGDEELLIMHEGVISNMWIAIPDDEFYSVTLKGKDGKKFVMDI